MVNGTLSNGSSPAVSAAVRRRGHRRGALRPRASLLLWAAPALIAYAIFVLYPLEQSITYSFYSWDGIGAAVPVGFANYLEVFSDPTMLSSLGNALLLIVFFAVIPITIGLAAAALIRSMRPGPFSTAARTVLFIPQVVPLVGAGIAWTFLYSSHGAINEILRGVGLGFLTTDWLGNFSTALPAVGIIGTWVSLGFCTVLFLAGIGRLDPSLFEAARLDGANRWQEFLAVTVPGLRREITVAGTITTISAISSFDVIFVSTNGGPGYQTLVPGVEIYHLAFSAQRIGAASALAIVLAVLVLLVVIIIQRIGAER